MNTQLATRIHARTRVSARALAVSALGPLTMLGGVIWAFVQPWRITLLHPRGQGFWWLFVEPPLLVVAVGAAFAVLVVPGLLEDLRDWEDDASR